MPQYPFGDMGPVEVIWAFGVSGEEQALSPFLGPINLTLEDSIKDIQEEGLGETAVDAVVTGSKCELEVPMTRNTLAQLQQITHGSLDSHGNLQVPAFVGCSMRDQAQPIMIKPVCNNVVSIVPAEWLYIYYAYPYRSFTLTFSRDEQRKHVAKFKIFASLDSDTYGLFYQYGFET